MVSRDDSRLEPSQQRSSSAAQTSKKPTKLEPHNQPTLTLPIQRDTTPTLTLSSVPKPATHEPETTMSSGFSTKGKSPQQMLALPTASDPAWGAGERTTDGGSSARGESSNQRNTSSISAASPEVAPNGSKPVETRGRSLIRGPLRQQNTSSWQGRPSNACSACAERHLKVRVSSFCPFLVLPCYPKSRQNWSFSDPSIVRWPTSLSSLPSRWRGGRVRNQDCHEEEEQMVATEKGVTFGDQPVESEAI